jgi:hypothetical protein
MLENLANLVAVLVALSLASERLVELVKNLLPFDYLRTEQAEPDAEARRQGFLQLLAVGAGILTAALAQEVLGERLRQSWFLLGLLASGGSGFWTSILGYITSIKDIKKSEAVDTRVRAAATVAAIASGITMHPAAAFQPGLAPNAPGGNAQPLAGAQAARDNLEEVIRVANATL